MGGWRFVWVNAAMATALVPMAPRAATLTVNAYTDGADASHGDGRCDTDAVAPGDQCTLRAAVQEANATPGPDTILLAAGRYVMSVRGSGEEGAATGDLDVVDPLTITGAGASSTTIDGRKARDRIFDVFSDLTLSGVTVQKGKARDETGGGCIQSFGSLTVSDATITRCKSSDDGAGINVKSGMATVRDTTVSHNRSRDDAGGMDVDGSRADLTRVTFIDNRAHDEGGGFENSDGIVTLTDCRFERNRARTEGGGLVNEDGGTMSLRRVSIVRNKAPLGGGISTRTTDGFVNTTTVAETTIEKNRKKNCAGPLTSLGGNVAGDGSCGF